MTKILRNIKIIFITILAAFTAIIWYAVFYFETPNNLTLTIFDVGQGDSIFIDTGGNQVLIDGGPGNAVLSKLGREMPFWDNSIDLLILTHAHADHVDGLVEVLKRYQVGMILESGEEYSTPEYHEWHELIKQKNIPVVIARRGQIVHINKDAVLSVLSPFENYNGVSVKNPHDANVSTKLIYGKNSVLLMGDAEKSIEYRLLYENPDELKSDILKVGHHGSKTSTTKDFLAAVSPKIAVISVGRHNRYGHPHQEVLDRLKSFGIRIFRTDEDGNIKFAINKEGFVKE